MSRLVSIYSAKMIKSIIAQPTMVMFISGGFCLLYHFGRFSSTDKNQTISYRSDPKKHVKCGSSQGSTLPLKLKKWDLSTLLCL